MPAQKLSISLPDSLVRFIEDYQKAKGCSSRSQVIESALISLQNKELEIAYQKASLEVEPDWDVTVNDGLADETW